MAETTYATRRAQLEAERDRVTGQLAELGVDRSSFDEGFADSGQVTAERGEVQALAGTLRETLQEIDAALGKIERGTYGHCESCGKSDRRCPARGDAGRASVHQLRVPASLTLDVGRAPCTSTGQTSSSSSRWSSR